MINKTLLAGIPLFAVAAALIAFAGGGGDEPVCKGTPQRIVVVPFTTVSDVAVSKQLAPAVASQAVQRAAESCGLLATGIADARVQSDLALRTVDMTPTTTSAPNRKPHIRKLVKTGSAFIQNKLLVDLDGSSGTPGSPFLGALSKLAEELDARDWSGGTTIVLIGDGIAVEEAPSGASIDFRRRKIDRRAVSEYAELFEPLAGSCVMLIGTGAESNLDPETLRRANQYLGRVLKSVDAGFVAVRSSDLPTDCS